MWSALGHTNSFRGLRARDTYNVRLGSAPPSCAPPFRKAATSSSNEMACPTFLRYALAASLCVIVKNSSGLTPIAVVEPFFVLAESNTEKCSDSGSGLWEQSD